MKAFNSIKLLVMALVLSLAGFAAQAQGLQTIYVSGRVINANGGVANHPVTVQTDSNAIYGVVGTQVNTDANGYFNAQLSYPTNDSVWVVGITQGCGAVVVGKSMVMGGQGWPINLTICGGTAPVCNLPTPTISSQSLGTTPTGRPYKFVAATGGADSVAWIINNQTAGFGDSIIYTFPGPGTYSVCVYALNSQVAGCYKSACTSVTISNPATTYYINGMVLGGGAVISGARVELVKLNDSTNTVRNTTSTPNGYSFSQLSAGQYIVRAVPVSGGFIATYHPSAATWPAATIITVPGPQANYNITLISGGTTGGNGGINGTVGGNNDSIPANARVAANNVTFKLDRSTVLVKNLADNSLRATAPDAMGSYNFSNLPFGTYEVTVDFPRVNAVTGTVTLSASAPVYTVNFNKTVAGAATSVKDLQARKLNAWPNPARENLSLQLDNTFSQPEITVLNSLGQAMAAPVSVANGKASVATGQLPAGLYRLVVSQNGQSATASFIKE